LETVFATVFPLCGCDSAEVIVSAKTLHAKNEKTTANGMNLKTKLCGPAGHVLSKFFNSNESKHPGASIPNYVYSKDETTIRVRMTLKIKTKMRKTKNCNHVLEILSILVLKQHYVSTPPACSHANVILKLHQVSSQRCVYLGHRVSVFKFGSECLVQRKQFTFQKPRYHYYHHELVTKRKTGPVSLPSS